MTDFEKIKSLGETYGTPLYVYDRRIFEENADTLLKTILPGARLFYSIKANPLVGVCQIFKNKGLGIECASAGELKTAVKAGFEGKDIVFTSPGKTAKEIELAMEIGVKVINVETVAEAKLIDEIAAKRGVNFHIAVRINPAISYSNAKIKMAGVSSQFGIEEADIDLAFPEILALSNVTLIGIQMYMGTEILMFEDAVSNTEYGIKLALSLSEKFGFELKYLNVGGGFGVKYFPNETPLDTEALAAAMKELSATYKAALSGTEVIFESGRFLTATAGEYVTKVLYVKESKGTKYVVCDGGSSFHSASAFLGRFVRNNFPLHVFPEGEEKAVTTITGPLCTPLDVLGQKVEINAEIQPGDFVVIENSGAYGLSYSPVFFLGHELPAEVLLDGDQVKVLRESQDAELLLRGQHSL
ncbi:MAG: diaminopimelate decarboxylase [Pseudobutyrivibrio sp.]|nr:diaminopimelate decarboxylase [Pseudobutyrivibrio sp.]